MGLWNFIKNAGEIHRHRFGRGGGGAGGDRGGTEGSGLEAEGIEVAVEGDTVRLKGRAPSQEMREKIILAAGNVEGVSAVEEEIEAPDAADPVFHEVQKGDSLWKIAEKHLGNGARYPEIFEANKPMLSDPDKIYPGQMLRIPA